MVITTSLAPVVPTGVTAVIWVDEVQTTFAAAAPPIVTPNEPPDTKSVPAIVTAVSPVVGPEFGEMLVKVGGDT